MSLSPSLSCTCLWRPDCFVIGCAELSGKNSLKENRFPFDYLVLTINNRLNKIITLESKFSSQFVKKSSVLISIRFR